MGIASDAGKHGQTAADVRLAEGVGFEPTREREPPGGFQDRCLKPLGHPSNCNIFNSLFLPIEGELRLLPCRYRAPLVRSFSAAEIIASTWRAAPSCIQAERGRRDRAPGGSLASWPRPLREGGRHIRIGGCPAPGCRPPSIAATDRSAAATQRPAHVEPNCRSRRPRINARSSGAMAPQIRISGPRPERRLITPSVRADAYGWSCCSACRC